MKKYIVIVLLFIAVFSALSQYNEQTAFSFLQDTFNRGEKDLYDMLLQDAKSFIRTFPDGERTADAHVLVGNILEAKGDKHQAFAAFLKAAVLYPQTEAYFKAVDNVRYFLGKEDDYEDSKSDVLDYLDRPKKTAPAADLNFDYLYLLTGLEQKRLREWTVESLNEFVEKYPGDERSDRIVLWKAQTYMLDDRKKEAENSLAQLSVLFPQSRFMPEALYSQAELLTEKLGKHDEAIDVLHDIVHRFPDNEFAPKAQLKLGQILEKRTKDYQSALNAYGVLVNNYPDYFQVYDACWALAKINKDRLKDYPAAINSLEQMITKDTTDVRAIEAFEEIAEIYKDKLRDDEMAAQTYVKLVDYFPEYEKAPDRLMDAGRLYDEKVGDLENAFVVYERIEKNYPNHKKAREAAQRKEKLQEKMNVEIETPTEKTDVEKEEKSGESYF